MEITKENIASFIVLAYPQELKSSSVVDEVSRLYTQTVPWDLASQEYFSYSHSIGFFNFLEAATNLDEQRTKIIDSLCSATEVSDLYDAQNFEGKMFLAGASTPFSRLRNFNEVVNYLKALGSGQHPKSPHDQGEKDVCLILRNRLVKSANIAYDLEKLDLDFKGIYTPPNKMNLLAMNSYNSRVKAAEGWGIVGQGLHCLSNPSEEKIQFRASDVLASKEKAVEILKNTVNSKRLGNFTPALQNKITDMANELTLVINSHYEAHVLHTQLSTPAANIKDEYKSDNMLGNLKEKLLSPFSGKKKIHKL